MSAGAPPEPTAWRFEPPDLCLWTLVGEVSGGVACVDASFPLRVIVMLVSKAASLIHSFPMCFFATHEGARAWFFERRRELSRPSGHAR
jgi:hypothetical protein